MFSDAKQNAISPLFTIWTKDSAFYFYNRMDDIYKTKLQTDSNIASQNITKLPGDTTILKQKCSKYKIITKMKNRGEFYHIVWFANKLFTGKSYYSDLIKNIPLQIERYFTKTNGEIVTKEILTAQKIEKQRNKRDFVKELTDYKIKDIKQLDIDMKNKFAIIPNN